MKVCNTCKESKSEEYFYWKNKSKGTRSSMCKLCQKSYSKSHFDNNKDYYKKKAHVSRPAAVKRNKQFVIDYLLGHPCVDCNESDIEVLQFDHVVPLADWKADRVTSLMSQSINRIQQEIDKCEVRCANCHIRRTRRMAGTLRMSV